MRGQPDHSLGEASCLEIRSSCSREQAAHVLAQISKNKKRKRDCKMSWKVHMTGKQPD